MFNKLSRIRTTVPQTGALRQPAHGRPIAVFTAGVVVHISEFEAINGGIQHAISRANRNGRTSSESVATERQSDSASGWAFAGGVDTIEIISLLATANPLQTSGKKSQPDG